MLAKDVGRELGDDGLPDAIVRRLHGLAPVAHRQLHEAPRAQVAQTRIDLGDTARGAPQDRGGQGTSVGRHELEQSPRVGIEALHAPLDHLLERRPGVQQEGVGVRRQALRVHAPGEVLDEERASSRPAGDGVGHALRALVDGTDQVEGELPRLIELERSDEDAPHVGALEALLEQLLQERARLRVPALPLPEDQQEARGVRGTHDLGEQGGAVDVAPVDVVEVQDHRSEPGHLRQERAKCRERLLSHALRVVDGALG